MTQARAPRARIESMHKLRLLLADDHEAVLCGLAQMLAGPRIAIAGLARDGGDAVRLAMRVRPDVALLDVIMPKLDGFAATRELRRVLPATKVILMTGFFEDRHLADAWRAGAWGLAVKSQPLHELKHAVREVAKGKIYVCPSLGPTRPPAHTPTTLLSRREQQVLQLVAEGHHLKDVARICGISVRTVEHHHERLKSKLGINNTANLVRYAIRVGLIEA